MLRDKAGNRLFRKMTVKVVFPDAIFPDKTFIQHAGPHQGFGPGGVDEMLQNIADQLDTLYPWWDFTFVEMTPVGSTARYVFTYVGPRAQGIPKPTESTTPEPEMVKGPNPLRPMIGSENTPQQPPSQELVQS